jgi:hypothetical protein
MPTLPNGDPMRPIDFQFDPELEQRERADKEMKEMKREQAMKLKNNAKRALLAAGRGLSMGAGSQSDEEGEGEEDERSLSSYGGGGGGSRRTQQQRQDGSAAAGNLLHRPKLHTRLTTEKGLQLYRSIMLKLLTVYVKVMPGHDVLRLQLDPEDTVWHLHNMFKTHHLLGSRRGSMLILPTSVGLFHMDADMVPENEFMKARRTALLQMKDYGFIRRNSCIVTIYVPYYKDDTLIPIMRNYIQENLMPRDHHQEGEGGEGGGHGPRHGQGHGDREDDWDDEEGYDPHQRGGKRKPTKGLIDFNIPNILHNKTIPENLENDEIQKSLLPVVIRNFHDQQIHKKARYQIMGRRYQENVQKLQVEKQKLLVVSMSNKRCVGMDSHRCLCRCCCVVVGEKIRRGSITNSGRERNCQEAEGAEW